MSCGSPTPIQNPRHLRQDKWLLFLFVFNFTHLFRLCWVCRGARDLLMCYMDSGCGAWTQLLYSRRNLSSLTRDWTPDPRIGRQTLFLKVMLGGCFPKWERGAHLWGFGQSHHFQRKACIKRLWCFSCINQYLKISSQNFITTLPICYQRQAVRQCMLSYI